MNPAQTTRMSVADLFDLGLHRHDFERLNGEVIGHDRVDLPRGEVGIARRHRGRAVIVWIAMVAIASLLLRTVRLQQQ